MYLLPPGPKAPLPTVLSPQEATPEVRERFGGIPELGLYASKKTMFKGHKWERLQEQKDIKPTILLRDMDKRIREWKSLGFVLVL